jgi:hypothetical protein
MKIKDLQQGKGYISLSLSDMDTDRIHKILDELGIENYIPDLHLTLMYDRSNPNISYTQNNNKYLATINSCKLLGEPTSKWFAIALDLHSPELSERHAELLKLGYKHSYPDFVAHISLKYQPTEQDVNTIKNNIKKFIDLGNITLEQEKLKEIKE